MSFEKLGVIKHISSAIKELGYEKPKERWYYEY